jgi:ribose-phosphate pyrophosphokinase
MQTSDSRYSSQFITPEQYEVIGKRELMGPNGWLLFVACNAGIEFAAKVKAEFEKMLTENNSAVRSIPIVGTREHPITAVFTDTETCPRLPTYVTGANAFVFQCCQETITGNTVNENIQQLLQVVRTLRAHRANNITVVTPYSPYSRQDKPTFMQREAALAGLFADQLKIAGANIHLSYHPHTYALHGFYEPEMVFFALSGLALFVEIFEDRIGRDDTVVVSTDAGGAKFTVHYANAMDITYAIANKFRTGKDKSNLLGIIGDLENKKTAIIIDDESVTGSSVLHAARQLHDRYGINDIYICLSHFKLTKEHFPKLIDAHQNWGLKEVHITDTIPQIPELAALDFVKVHSIARRFATSINRMHYNQSVSRLFQEREKF